jgi:hypothetical protein
MDAVHLLGTISQYGIRIGWAEQGNSASIPGRCGRRSSPWMRATSRRPGRQIAAFAKSDDSRGT